MSRLVGLSEASLSSTISDGPYFSGTGNRSQVYTKSRLLQRRWIIYKRVQDVILASVLALWVSVVMVIIGIWIKCDSSGPILFSQPRRGRNDIRFPCYKFRTMYHHCTDLHAHSQSVRGDPRITRIGARLRKLSMDELPQLINVMRGDMSLIGPRPHAAGTNIDGRLLSELSDNYMLRYSIKPGITGWAQVNGWRGILDTEEKLKRRLEYDLEYIARWSPWLDVKILYRTIFCIFDNHHVF